MEDAKKQTSRPLENLMTPVELSQLLGVSRKTIYHWVLRREIPFTKVGRHLRFNARAVLAHFEKKTEQEALSCPSYAALVESRYRSLTSR